MLVSRRRHAEWRKSREHLALWIFRERSCIVNVKRCFQQQRKLMVRAFDTPLEPSDHVCCTLRSATAVRRWYMHIVDQGTTCKKMHSCLMRTTCKINVYINIRQVLNFIMLTLPERIENYIKGNTVHEKNSFVQVFKNLTRYRFEHNFVGPSK